MSDDTDLTLEEVDLAIAAAQMRGDSQEDLALLWYIRAETLGIRVRHEYLHFVMGVSYAEAKLLTERLMERGFMEAEVA